MGAAFVEKEEFFEVVQPTRFCSIFGMKEILECLRISLVLLVLSGALMQHATSWWCTNYTKLFCNYNLLMIY